MTPLSAFSSGGLQSNYKGSNEPAYAHVTPAEIFSPLTSPALRPQNPSSENFQRMIELANSMNIGSSALDQHARLQQEQAFLQGQQHILSVLGLGHLPSNFDPNGGDLSHPVSNGSIHTPINGKATSAEASTSRGRGASRQVAKSRPSPIIKPINRTTAPNNGKARGSRSSLDGGSLRSSPNFGPLNPSPVDKAVIRTNNTPSPVDISSGPLDLSPSADPVYAPVTPSSLMKLPSQLGMMMGMDSATTGKWDYVGKRTLDKRVTVESAKRSATPSGVPPAKRTLAPAPAPRTEEENRRREAVRAKLPRKSALKAILPSGTSCNWSKLAKS